ncbi:hypothetical protein [Lentibacillus sp. Marseille-P4043]|nr:hypothetical protein [Lentibacillus sp. Marseille-P4043]
MPRKLPPIAKVFTMNMDYEEREPMVVKQKMINSHWICHIPMAVIII